MSESPRGKPRVVLDTNVWLDWLVFDDPGIVPIRNAVGTGRVELYLDAVCEAELVEVLARGFAKRTLDEAAQAQCIAQCRRLAKRIDTTNGVPAFAGTTVSAWAGARAALPVCKDPDDQKFLEAALAAGAQFLVTKDRALLELAKRRSRLPFRILAPADFRAALS
jgi:putative PIN family toxin of toxin-antitoxin system